MKTSDRELERRLNAELRSMLSQGSRRASISSICKRAGVSRSRLYSEFPEIVKKLRRRLGSQDSSTVGRLRNQVRDLKSLNATLARTCLELKAALVRALHRLDQVELSGRQDVR